MAVAVLGPFNQSNLRSSRLAERRHYKKDSRFVLDLYTLTYDSHESLDSLGVLSKKLNEAPDVSNSCTDNKNASWTRYNVDMRNDQNPIFRCRKLSLQPRWQDSKNLQSCFLNDQLAEIEDSYIDDTVLSLPPIPQSKYLLHNSDTNSLPVVNEEITTFTPTSVGSNFNSSEINTTNNLKNGQDNKKDNNSNLNCRVRAEAHQKNTTEPIRANINWDTTRWSSQLREISAPLKKVYAETQSRMESQHSQRPNSPITCAIKSSLKKVGFEDGTNEEGRCRMNKSMIAKMNTNQLQTIINDLHVHVEYLNEQLMEMLIEKDELHVSRDSLLVDIEDLTAYLNAKQVNKKNSRKFCISNNYVKNTNNNDNSKVPVTCPKNLISGLRFSRLTSYIKN